jgi:ParB-like chromosome segregation protein Spo0J
MKIQKLRLADITPYWRNPRDNAGAVEAVKASIEAFGMNQPLVLDTKRVIIAGHTRYKALLEMGALEADCIIAPLSDQKAKEYRIADNKTNELADWDMDKLIPELRELEDLSEMQVYFGDEDLTELLEETGGVNTRAVTQDTVDAAQASAATKFDSIETSATASMVEILCTHCGMPSYVTRDDVLRRLDGDIKD